VLLRVPWPLSVRATAQKDSDTNSHKSFQSSY
jgi:hypothetical protein